MKAKEGSNLYTLVLLLALVASSAAVTCAQTTGFTYQGRLTDGGTTANGTYDMQFKLFDSATVGSGNQIGAGMTNGAVTVSAGVFTVQLDFGAGAFPGADRFVEIGVRPTGSTNPYTLLSPRQQLTSAVYAIRAGATTTADTATNAAQLGGVPASQYAQTNDSRLTDARPPTPGSSNYIQNTTSQQAASNFNISGTASAAAFVGSTVSVSTVGASAYYLNNARVLSGSNGGQNLFVGVDAGNTSMSGTFNTFAGFGAGRANTTGVRTHFSVAMRARQIQQDSTIQALVRLRALKPRRAVATRSLGIPQGAPTPQETLTPSLARRRDYPIQRVLITLSPALTQGRKIHLGTATHSLVLMPARKTQQGMVIPS